MPRYNLFRKMVILLLIMLVPIVGLYLYSNKTSTGVLGEELNRSNTNQLIFFQNQVNTNMDLLTLWPNLLIQDPDILTLKDIFSYSKYLDLEPITLIKRIQTKLNIQESSSDWRSSLFIYSPLLQRVISVNDVRTYNDTELRKRLKPGWQVARKAGQNGFLFSLITVYPYSELHDPANANLIIELQFDSVNIQNMLDKFKSDGRRDPVFYKKGTGVIYNRTADTKLADKIIASLQDEKLHDIDYRTVKVDGSSYMVNVVNSKTTGWYLIDYMPLADIFKPIQKSNLLFYISVGCLLLMSCLAAYLLYAQVQVPLKKLVQGFQRLKNGDYSVRMESKGNNEFGFVFARFNSMVAQIQDLFEKVYMEKIHVREARLKQLQSQINPHFFYNCFSFISSMAKLQNHQAVVAMSQNLSKYYRYTTRQERDLVPLSEELEFVTSYLEIQKMRMKRLDYDIEIPLRMRKLDIPPLILQPLVENAVIHGIESRSDAGWIRIYGQYEGDRMCIIVEDDGKGMEPAELAALESKLYKPMDEKMGCGLWNVHQRMQLRFGDAAGLNVSESPLGGLKVTLKLDLGADGRQSNDGGQL
ncbi:sensor histidine kinase [Paenibacillus sp. sptzw28]|uniref:sensor histidine kinase n=1 Tax=Paenibacillus sp. sptzw28 TaxID=715179 RepID=UPI001C6F2C23|nr:histidine kinase [Paenibacillus sp. sptzw28]QYR23012.1 sensor histidine kinase [Paenibacillus sp. sptzw28]